MAIVAWTLDQSLTLTALQRDLAHGQTSHIHYFDQGVRYTVADYVVRLEQAGVAVNLAEVGQA